MSSDVSRLVAAAGGALSWPVEEVGRTLLTGLIRVTGGGGEGGGEGVWGRRMMVSCGGDGGVSGMVVVVVVGGGGGEVRVIWLQGLRVVGMGELMRGIGGCCCCKVVVVRFEK